MLPHICFPSLVYNSFGNTESTITKNLDDVAEQLHLFKGDLGELKDHSLGIGNGCSDAEVNVILAIVVNGCLDYLLDAGGDVGVNASAEDKLYGLGGVGILVSGHIGHSSLSLCLCLLLFTTDALKLCLADSLNSLFFLYLSESFCLGALLFLSLTGDASVLCL